MSAFGGTADRARLLLARPNKIRYFLQSIFPANRAGKIMGRPVRDDFGSGRFGVDKTAQRRAPWPRAFTALSVSGKRASREQAMTGFGPLKLTVFVALCAIMFVIVIATEGNPLVVIAVVLIAIFLAGRLFGSR
jgi:hypothetical protein